MRNDKYVIVKGAVILWDGISKPEELDGDKGGFKYSLKVAIPANSPEVAELQAIGTEELNSGCLKGAFPAGGHWVMNPVDPTKYEGALPAHMELSAITYSFPTEIFNAQTQRLDRMQVEGQLYAGAVVDVIVSARSYNNKSKGVGLWLNGIKIVNPKAPKLPGCGGIDASKMFGAPVGPNGEPTFAGPPTPGAPPASGPPAPAATAPPTGGAPMPPGVVPSPGFLNPPPPAKQMTAKAAGVTYEAFIAQGWTDQMLIAHGYMIETDVPI